MTAPGNRDTSLDKPARVAAPRFSEQSLAWIVAGTAALVVLFMFTPRFGAWRGVVIPLSLKFPEIHRSKHVLEQLMDPWAPIDNPSNNVIAWRLLFPLIFYYGHLPTWLYLLLPFIGCGLVLGLFALLTQRRLGDWQITWLATALFAALPWFFVSTGWLTYFDSWLILGLLIVSFVPSRWALAAVCLLEPWIDERFVFALPVAIAVRAVALGHVENRRWRDIALDIAVIAAASVPYPLVRAISWINGDAETNEYVSSHRAAVLTVPLPRFVEGLWSGFRAAWLLVGVGIWLVGKRLGWTWGIPYAMLVFGSALGGLLIAADMSRTMMIIAPALALGIWLLGDLRAPHTRYLLAGVLAVNLILPAEHVLWPFKVPIRYFYAMLDDYYNPPTDLRPVTYVQMGNDARAGNQRAAAEFGYDIALRLDSTFVPAYVARAAMKLDLDGPAAAMDDLREALRLDPKDPDALLLRGITRQTRGDTKGAIEDVDKALANAPPEWPMRQQAEDFLRQATGQQAPPTGASP